MKDVLDVLVIGAGPAGLAASRELGLRGLDHRVLEAGAVGASWDGYYRSLVLHTGRHLSALPGLPLPGETPLFPPREAFLAYLRDYARRFALPIREGFRVDRAEWEDGIWRLRAGDGWLESRALVVATGIASNPHRPALPGEEAYRGRILHSSAYREPGPFAGKKVLVVGVGNSGGEIAAELGRAGVRTAASVRSGAHMMPLRIAGLPSQYWSVLLERLPKPLPGLIANNTARLLRVLKGKPPLPVPDRDVLERPPLIGDSLPRALRSGQVVLRGAIRTLLPGGVRFADGLEEDFDILLMATGFRPALDFFADPLPVDSAGFPRKDHPIFAERGLFFLGHRYGTTGALFNIRRDAPRLAGAVEARLKSRPRPS